MSLHQKKPLCSVNFAPSYKPDPYLLFKDLNKCIRNLTLKRFFLNTKEKTNLLPIVPEFTDCCFDFDSDIIEILEELYSESTQDQLENFTQHLHTSPSVVHSTLKAKSFFYPYQSKGPHLTTFYNMVFADIKRLCAHSSSHSTNLGFLPPHEKKALSALAANDDLIIKTADKGGGIVIQNR